MKSKYGVIVGLAISTGILAALAGCASSSSTSPVSAPATTVSASSSVPTNTIPSCGPGTVLNSGGTACVTDTSAPASSAPASSAPASSAPAAPASPSMTIAQQQAVTAAQQYLALGSGFSYEGLLQQLTSSAGSGFSQADAKFAINYLKPNWDQQAVLAAKGYLALGGFSQSSLLQQLMSSAGSGFTYAQAEYAVNKTMG